MAVATLKLAGRKFVVIPEREYRDLKARASAGGNGSGKPARAKRKPTRQERGDIAESIRRLADPRRVPAEEVFRKLGV